MDCSDKIIHCEAMADIANKVHLWIVLTNCHCDAMANIANKVHLWIVLTKLFIVMQWKILQIKSTHGLI